MTNGSALVQAGQDVPAQVETAATAMAAAQKALIEAAYIVAARNPRNMEGVRQQLLAECDRPGFAESARYLKPVGKQKIAGLSIRFAEAAYRIMGNLDCQQAVTFDDEVRRIVKVTVRDLETNAHLSADVLIEKTVERRAPDAQREKLGERKNSRGEMVYILSATDDEVQVKGNAMMSKARRNLILAFLPGDIADECDRRVMATLAKQDKEDPRAALRRITDNFLNLGVDAVALAAALGHDLETISPAELQVLRTLYQAVRDGEATVADITGAAEARDADPTSKSKGVEGLKLRLGLKDQPVKEKKAEPKAEAPAA